jgi:hypothetical protein
MLYLAGTTDRWDGKWALLLILSPVEGTEIKMGYESAEI